MGAKLPVCMLELKLQKATANLSPLLGKGRPCQGSRLALSLGSSSFRGALPDGGTPLTLYGIQQACSFPPHSRKILHDFPLNPWGQRSGWLNPWSLQRQMQRIPSCIIAISDSFACREDVTVHSTPGGLLRGCS